MYLIGNQKDLLVAAHHTFVGTVPRLRAAGSQTAGKVVFALPDGAPSLVAPMMLSADEVDLLRADHRKTAIKERCIEVADHDVSSCLLARKDGRMSEAVQQLVSAPRELATLRGLFPGVCGSQARSPSCSRMTHLSVVCCVLCVVLYAVLYPPGCELCSTYT